MNLTRSQEIITKAITDHKPYAIVTMFSGGDDSLTAYHVAKALKVPVTHLMHGVTGTGIPETTRFARKIGEQSGLNYIEANAGNAYEDYILRKGFFGVGRVAHDYAYHNLKAQPFRTALSKEIRHRKRGRNILLINGARWQESANRKRLKNQSIRVDAHTPSNIWVNIINDWSKKDCRNFLESQERNPVTDLLHRSGECLCGTMQRPFGETRKEISFWFPKWGQWLNDLEGQACKRGFCWGWGEDLPPDISERKRREKQIKNGQLEFSFTPLCQSCQYHAKETR